MSGSEEPNLFLRKQNDSDDYDEKWDDSEIIAAYDKAVSAVKRRLTRKIQRELGLKDEDVKEFLSEAESSGSKGKKSGKNRNKKKKRKWTVGSSCRAVFSEDGEEYEAVIIKMDGHWCVVRYIGYDNEEEVLLEDLSPSLGKNVIQAQIEAASNQQEEDISDTTRQEEHVPKAKVKSETFSEENPPSLEGHTQAFEPSMKRFPMSFPLPPPPPAFPAMMNCCSVTKEDDINSMLMSWYMCGYYTGLYERGQQLQKH